MKTIPSWNVRNTPASPGRKAEVEGWGAVQFQRAPFIQNLQEQSGGRYWPWAAGKRG
ncbi:MAG: hypothetical protein AB1813_07790 [Verrucomicrobiota bacterium]